MIQRIIHISCKLKTNQTLQMNTKSIQIKGDQSKQKKTQTKKIKKGHQKKTKKKKKKNEIYVFIDDLRQDDIDDWIQGEIDGLY